MNALIVLMWFTETCEKHLILYHTSNFCTNFNFMVSLVSSGIGVAKSYLLNRYTNLDPSN